MVIKFNSRILYQLLTNKANRSYQMLNWILYKIGNLIGIVILLLIVIIIIAWLACLLLLPFLGLYWLLHL